MAVRETVRTARRPMIGVLLVGVLVAACGSKGSPVAVGAHTPADSPAPAPVSAAAGSTLPASSAARPAVADAAPSRVSLSPAAPASPTTAASPAVAPSTGPASGQTGTRAQVPWSQVGPGWFLVTSDSSVIASESGSALPASKGGTATLWLVSPTGGRYAITSWPGYAAGQDPINLAGLTAWSATGREALFSNPGGVVVEVDLTTGVRHAVSVPGLSTAGFTSPTGANLVTVVDDAPRGGPWLGESLVRLNLDGKPQVTIAEADHASLEWLYSPDGATVYLNGRGGLRTVSNAGGAIRALQTFETPDADCVPVSWWDEQTILADCTNGSGSRLWLVQAAVGSATPLTAMPGSDRVALGYNNAVRAGDAVFAQHLEGCGVVTIQRLAANGVGTHVAIPESLSNDRLIGAVGSKIAVQSSTECGSPSWFGFYDAATNTTQKIVPDVPGEVGVLSALAFP
jgi:hypothetical protein